MLVYYENDAFEVRVDRILAAFKQNDIDANAAAELLYKVHEEELEPIEGTDYESMSKPQLIDRIEELEDKLDNIRNLADPY